VLVLSRRSQEKVILPGLDIVLQVVSIKGNVVRLGIEAPPDVKIIRAELLQDEAPTPDACLSVAVG